MRSLHNELLERLDEVNGDPGLTAAADQHAAAVRDIIQGSGLPLNERTLRDYRRGFLEVCMEKGWWPGEEFDWELLRATAIERALTESSSAR